MCSEQIAFDLVSDEFERVAFSTCCCLPGDVRIHCGRCVRSMLSISTITPARSSASIQRAWRSRRSMRGNATIVSTPSPAFIACASSALAPATPGLPLGNRTSTIFLSANSDSACAPRQALTSRIARRHSACRAPCSPAARSRANRILRFERQQRFVTCNHKDRRQAPERCARANTPPRASF